jgi:PP-loop superfamily ATP-utilizing enzyme
LGYDHVCVDLAGYRTGSMNTAPRGNRQERP